MELIFTGVGSAFNLKDGSNSAYFEYQNNLFVIDSGETTYETLSDRIDYKKYESINYLITHTHNDHIGSLGTTISDLFLNVNIKVNIIHPISTVQKLLDLMGIERKMYNYIETKNYQLLGLKINFIETKHVENMECFGILIDNLEDVIYYSGDSNMIPTQIFEWFMKNEINYIYQDTCISKESSSGHLYYEKLRSLFPKEYLSRIYCMHLEPNSKEFLENKGFNVVESVR